MRLVRYWCVQVGNNFVVDASQEEEGCATSCLSVAVNSSRHTLSVIKDGPGGIPRGKLHESITVCQCECCSPWSHHFYTALDFTVLLQMAQEVGLHLLKRMDDMLQPTHTPALGPTRTAPSLFT